MEDIKLIHTPETESTNKLMRQYTGEEGRLMTVCTADYQTAGHGQGTTKWESDRGCNLLTSIRLHPKGLAAAHQYSMTEAGALAVRDTVAHYTDNVSVKWPNDVYVGDRKISGTISECDISGTDIKTCTLGIGININQPNFNQFVPNPVSLRQIRGCDTDLDEVLGLLTDRLLRYTSMIDNGEYERLHNLYLGSLYRRHGLFMYEDAAGRFMAETVTVDNYGLLVLRRTDGQLSKYNVKEVKFIIKTT